MSSYRTWMRLGLLTLMGASGAVALAATGGPDAFGYVYAASDDPNGPAVTYDDISGTGTRLLLADEGTIAIQLPFPFEYYGGNYNVLYVSANGGVTTSFGAMPRTNQCLPSAIEPTRYLLPFWDDLDATSGGVYWEPRNDALGTYVLIQWHQVRRVASTDVLNFQAALFRDGTIEFRYAEMDNLGTSGTIGLQRLGGDASEYGCDTEVITSHSVLRYRHCVVGLDWDDDGFDECDDCDDSTDLTAPGQPEVCDGIDQDCDGVDGYDLDGDGWTDCARDCDDDDASINPGVEDVPCDGIDQDCDSWTVDNPDVDLDGFYACDDDCDDLDPLIFPGSVEVTCNALDDDCDAATPDDDDADGDGFLICDGDCDDSRADINPDGVEVICNGADDDCDAATLEAPDVDDDGNSVCDGDCDDSDPAINALRTDRPCNGVDDDCDPSTPDEADLDGDGYSVCVDDCDDNNAAINPGMSEVLCNYIDDDCRNNTGDDNDNDRDGVSVCQDDCDDNDRTVSPSLPEVCEDDLDNNCDGEVDEACVAIDTDVDTGTGKDGGCSTAPDHRGGFLALWLSLAALRRRQRA